MVLNLSVCCRDQLRRNGKTCQLQVVFLLGKIHFGVLKCSFLEIKEWINKMKKKKKEKRLAPHLKELIKKPEDN